MKRIHSIFKDLRNNNRLAGEMSLDYPALLCLILGRLDKLGVEEVTLGLLGRQRVWCRDRLCFL